MVAVMGRPPTSLARGCPGGPDRWLGGPVRCPGGPERWFGGPERWPGGPESPPGGEERGEWMGRPPRRARGSVPSDSASPRSHPSSLSGMEEMDSLFSWSLSSSFFTPPPSSSFTSRETPLLSSFNEDSDFDFESLISGSSFDSVCLLCFIRRFWNQTCHIT